MTERGTMQLGLDPETQTVHSAWGLVFVDPESVLLSLVDKGWGSGAFELRLLNTGNGEELARLTRSPGVVGFREGSSVVIRRGSFPTTVLSGREYWFPGREPRT